MTTKSEFDAKIAACSQIMGSEVRVMAFDQEDPNFFRLAINHVQTPVIVEIAVHILTAAVRLATTHGEEHPCIDWARAALATLDLEVEQTSMMIPKEDLN